MPTLNALAQLIGQAMMLTFGHPFLAGACLLIIIFAILYYHRVPADAAIVIAVPLMIALAGVFMPDWFIPFLVIGIGVIAALGFLKVVGWV